MTVSVGEAGLFHLTTSNDANTRKGLIFRSSEDYWPPLRRGPTIVRGETLSNVLRDGQNAASAPPLTRPLNAHERRASADKAERHQRRRAHLWDAIAFAYFRGWPLSTTVTVTWDRCAYSDPAHGHILAHPDRQRCARLRDDLWRAHRRVGLPFACTWVRDTGGGYGPHTHIGAWWALPHDKLVAVLTRLTGVGPTSKRLKRGEVAKAEGGGWLIQENTDPNPLRGALGWGAYQLGQETRHLLPPAMEGKASDVSRDLSLRAIEPFRQELEAWKRKVGWDQMLPPDTREAKNSWMRSGTADAC